MIIMYESSLFPLEHNTKIDDSLPFVQPLRTILKIGDCRVVPELHLAPLRDVPSNLAFFTRPSFGGSGYETSRVSGEAQSGKRDRLEAA
jgi:hypothetical protein